LHSIRRPWPQKFFLLLCAKISEMLILAIDTSTKWGSVAILRDRVVLAGISGEEDTPYSERLFRDLDSLRVRADFSLREVDVFAVAGGPGSFTGLRVGLTAVKGWAEVHGKPIVVVSGLEAIAAQTVSECEVVAPFLDAKRGQVYGALFQRDGEEGLCLRRIGEDVVLAPREFLAVVRENAGDRQPLFVSPTPVALPSQLIDTLFSGARVVLVSGVLAPVIGRLGFERARRGEFVDPLLLDANYVRRSDAELFWKGA
jgi:tRNA threonylcarbamoyladenosine biosynthesis protein TsaB